MRSRVSDEDILELTKEAGIYAQFEQDANTEVGKRLIKLLDQSVDETLKQFVSEQAEKVTESESRAIFFLASMRSKLQTIISLRDKYVNAASHKNALYAEVARLKGEK